VTPRKPDPAQHSEDELLEQWAFLDRLVERQAARLRAGFQDVEEVDEPAAGISEVEGLRRELERLAAELRTAQAAREAAEADARRSRDALIAHTATGPRAVDLQRRLARTEAARQQAEKDLAEAREALASSLAEVDSLRTQLIDAQHGFWRFGHH
jgi:chromosome segregation ATPase